MRALLIGFLLFSATSLFAADRPRVLVIDSYHGDYFWTQEYRSGIQQSLDECCDLSFFEMNTKNIPADEFQNMADKAWEYFQESKPDGVILADDNAVRFLGDRIARTGVPMTYLGVNENPRKYFLRGYKNVSGVLGRTPYRRNVSFIGRYLNRPESRVLVLFDDSVTAHAMFEGGFGGQIVQKLSGVHAEIRLVKTLQHWKTLVLKAKEEGFHAVALMLYHTLRDDNNQIADPNDVLKWTVQNASVPPFGIWKFSIDGDNGVVGGLLATGYPQGIEAANYLKEMLFNDKRMLTIKTAVESQLMFSRAQLHKWQIVLPDRIANSAQLLP